MITPETFCHYPWTGLFVGAHGDVRVCCPSKSIIGNLNDSRLDKIINNDLHKEIQDSILDNKWHKNCATCKNLEDAGHVSYRNFARPVEDFFEIKSLDADNQNFHNLKIVDVRWSNTCNLACNYCSEKFSSTWAAIKKIDIGATKEYYADVIQYISKYTKEIKILHLLGGEPLLMKENAELLANFDNKDVEVHVVTSGSVDLTKSPTFKELSKFENVNIAISFENTKDRYEYVRHNADWNLLIQNIKYIKENTNYFISIVPIYNIYSALDLVNFYKTIYSLFEEVTEIPPNIKPVIYRMHWNQLQHPDALDVFNFPTPVKQLAIEQLDTVIEKYSKDSTIDLDCDFLIQTRDLLKNSIEINKVSKFLDFTNDLETNLHVKKHSFFELWPELNFLKNYDIQSH
jgi:organic radical activating enzyme